MNVDQTVRLARFNQVYNELCGRKLRSLVQKHFRDDLLSGFDLRDLLLYRSKNS